MGMNPVKSLYCKLFVNDLARKLKSEIDAGDTVLDLGCGWNSPLQYCPHHYSLGVDSHDYYIQLSKQSHIHSEYRQADIAGLNFEPESYDVVLLAQVLEHFPKQRGYDFLKKIEPWARRKVIITTPNGFLSKPSCDGNVRQEHLSGWSVGDLEELGYRVQGSSGLKIIREKCRPTIYWRALFNMSSVFTKRLPGKAFQLFAVKETGM